MRTLGSEGTTIRGTCEACGKGYRLSSAGRDYTCKACGGTVHALEESAPEAVEEEPGHEGPHAHGHHGSVLEHRQAIDAARRRTNRKKQLVWGVFMLAVLGTVVGIQMTRPKPVQAALGGLPRDLAAAASELAEAWNAGDVEGLVQAFHPDARSRMRIRLPRVAENRGWTAGFSPARAEGGLVTEGSVAQPQKAVARLAYEDGLVRAQFLLQFEPLHERWFAYHVEIPPPPLAATLARFRAAWAQSSPAALVPLFPPDDAKKLESLVERKTRELGWSPSHPALGEGVTTGEQELRSATERVQGLKVETVFPVADLELRLRWQYRSEPDAWFLALLSFPKKP